MKKYIPRFTVYSESKILSTRKKKIEFKYLMDHIDYTVYQNNLSNYKLGRMYRLNKYKYLYAYYMV